MTRAFLDWLFSTASGGVVELQAFPSGAQAWTTPGAWRAFGKFVTDQTRAGQNVALGVATRQGATNGTAANLLELPALFCDLDKRPRGPPAPRPLAVPSVLRSSAAARTFTPTG